MSLWMRCVGVAALIGFFTPVNADGNFYPNWGDNGSGIVRLHFGIPGFNWASVGEIVMLPNGAVVVIGSIVDSNSYKSIGLMRLAPDGKLDANFGTNGFMAAVDITSSDKYSPTAAAIDSQGKLLIAGQRSNTANTDHYIFFCRFDAASGLPVKFPGVNKSCPSIMFKAIDPNMKRNEWLDAMTVQPDGKIVLAGIAYSQVAMSRLMPNGTFDQEFGQNGKLVFTPENYTSPHPYSVRIASNGKLVIGGGDSINGFLARLGSQGQVEATWPSLIPAIQPPNFQNSSYSKTIYSIQLIPGNTEDDVLAVGILDSANSFPNSWVTRIRGATGVADLYFGTGGYAFFSDDEVMAGTWAEKSAFQSGAGLLVPFAIGNEVFLRRYRLDGTLDSDFGNKGTQALGDQGYPKSIETHRDSAFVLGADYDPKLFAVVIKLQLDLIFKDGFQ